MHPAVAATATATAAAKNLAAFAFWFPFRMHSSNAFIIYQASTVQHSTAVVTCNVQRATGNRRLEATQFNSADSCCSCQLSRRRHLWTSPTLPCPPFLPHSNCCFSWCCTCCILLDAADRQSAAATAAAILRRQLLALVEWRQTKNLTLGQLQLPHAPLPGCGGSCN